MRVEKRLQPRLFFQRVSIYHRPLADLPGIDGLLLERLCQLEVAIADVISTFAHEIAGSILDEAEKAALHATASQ